MQKWAYYGLTMNQLGQIASGEFQGAPFGQAASSLGASGWELVLYFPTQNGFFEVIFKRPI
jgi:hypothetical protein